MKILNSILFIPEPHQTSNEVLTFDFYLTSNTFLLKIECVNVNISSLKVSSFMQIFVMYLVKRKTSFIKTFIDTRSLPKVSKKPK